MTDEVADAPREAVPDAEPVPGGEAGPVTEQGPSLRERADGLLEHGRVLIDETRATVPPVDIGFAAVERDGHIGGFLLAGAIAFRLFVFLLPTYLLALVVAGAVFAVDPTKTDDVASSAGMSDYLADTIGDAASTSHKSLWLLIPLTLYAMASTARSVDKAIAAAHARAWGIDLPKRKPHWVILGMIGFAVAVLGTLRLITAIRHGVFVPFAMALGALLYAVLWLGASRALPRRPDTPWSALVPGAVLVGAGTQGLYLFNVLYLNHKIQSASAAYGALGVAASALLWLYLLGRLMVAAPVLNATLWQRRTGEPDAATDPAAEAPPG